MHTRSSHTPSSGGSAGGLGRVLAGLLLLAFGASALPTTAGAQSGFPGAPSEPGLNLRVYPLDTWTPRAGLGIGAGVVAHHLGRRHAQGLLSVAPARHEQVATAAWASANPARAQQYVLADARALHTNRDWFYGLGPSAADDARQSIERSALTVRVRAGRRFLGRRLAVEPRVALALHRVDRVPRPEASALDARSQAHLQQLARTQVGPLRPTHTGLRIGMALRFDTRAAPSSTTERGGRLTTRWMRSFGLGASLVRYDRLSVAATGTLPLRGTHRLDGRLALDRTVARGRAAVPYYLRPTLGGGDVPGWARLRFVDSDRLVGSLLYRFPIAQLMGLVQVEGHAGVHAASVYDDVGSDATVALSFDESVGPADGSVPLRPAASVGLHVGLSSRQSPSLDLALGASPEGVTAVRVRLTRALQAFRPPHHRLRSWW